MANKSVGPTRQNGHMDVEKETVFVIVHYPSIFSRPSFLFFQILPQTTCVFHHLWTYGSKLGSIDDVARRGIEGRRGHETGLRSKLDGFEDLHPSLFPHSPVQP